MMIPVSVKSLDCSQRDGAFALATECGQSLRAKSVVVASGARYRRPEIENLDDFEGRGVWYWASPIEARLCAEQDVVLVGGGNSAGQAAVFLSGHARKVHMVIRGGGLGASMSRYLIERIEATPNIELVFNTEVVGARRQRGRLAASACAGAAAWRRRRAQHRYPQPVSVRRRRSRHRLARRLRRDGRSRRFRGDRRAVQARMTASGVGAGNLGARRVRGRRRALRLGQARRRRDRRGRAGGGGAARLSRRHRETGALTGGCMMAKGCTHIAGIRRHAERARLRGMPEKRQRVAASADLPHLRPCRLLRRFAQQARDRAFPCHRASRHRGLRSAGRLGLVLCRRSDVRSVEAKDAAQRSDPALLLNSVSTKKRNLEMQCVLRTLRAIVSVLAGTIDRIDLFKPVRASPRRRRRKASSPRSTASGCTISSPARAIPSCCCMAMPKPATCGCR